MKKLKLLMGLLALTCCLSCCQHEQHNPPCRCELAPNASGSRITYQEAVRKIENYGSWAGKRSLEIQRHLDPTIVPHPDSLRFPTSWTFPFAFTDPTGNSEGGLLRDSVRAYLGIPENAAMVKGIPELELIIVQLDQNGQDSVSTAMMFDNLIRPCPNSCDTSSAMYEAFMLKFVEEFPVGE